MFRKPYFGKTSILAVMMLLASAWGIAATFGKVVAIGGEAADIALDEPRGVLYIANFTANRIDVMSLTSNTIRTSINVSNLPSSLSISPDDHWLIATQYGNNGSNSSPTNAVTLIDLTNNYARQTFSISDTPLGVAFGMDNNALIVTASSFQLFNPSTGSVQLLQTISQVATTAIPQPTATFPPTFTQASIAVSHDGSTIAGFGGSGTYLLFRYNVPTKTITSSFYTSSPPAGPRVVSLSDDGSLMSLGWWLADQNFITTAEFPSPSGLLNVGSHVIDSSRNLVYAQVPPAGTPQNGNTALPVLQILDSDNLTLREQIYIPENLAGKSLLSADHNTMYSVSDSGVLVLPVGSLNKSPRLSASVEEIAFRGNFCNRNSMRQTVTVTDPGGNHTPFTIQSNSAGVVVSPSSGTTPAVVTISVDPNVYASQTGTTTGLQLTVSHPNSIDVPTTVAVRVNSADPAQKGIFLDIPGTVVDLYADPKRPAYYALRQDKNQVLVFNSGNNTQTATLRTCTKPTGMAVTYDQQYLLVGCDNSHYMSVYDLDLLQPVAPVTFLSEYVESVATSTNAILAVTRSAADGTFGIDQINLGQSATGYRNGNRLAQLGVWANGKLPQNSVLTSSPNGAHILVAGADGTVMIYDAVAGTFTVSRQDFSSLNGAYAASNFNQYVVGNNLLDFSGAPQLALQVPQGLQSGFAFVNQTGYMSSATTASGPGVITQVNLANGNSMQPTYMVEAPLVNSPSQALPPGTTSCTTTSSTVNGKTETAQSCIVGSTKTTILTTCSSTNTSSTSSQTCTTTTTSASVAGTNVFMRSVVPLPDQSGILNLTTSGVTVLPWNYSASVALPLITNVVSAADGKSAPAPGGLIEILGSQFSAINLATNEIPLPTALANSCVTINGQPMPLVFVGPNQINAQMPAQAFGDVTVQIYTPGGVSDNFNLVVPTTSPAVFLSGVAGPMTNIPTVVRDADGELVTDSNPIHRGDNLTIYLTGCGQTSPQVTDGAAAPMNPLALVINTPVVTMGGVTLNTMFGGLTPGSVGLCQINVSVPSSVPQGLSVPLTITQGSGTQTLNFRVVD